MLFSSYFCYVTPSRVDFVTVAMVTSSKYFPLFIAVTVEINLLYVNDVSFLALKTTRQSSPSKHTAIYRLSRMVLLDKEAMNKSLDELIFTINNDEDEDDESEDESCAALNVSCHGTHFQQMVQENKCDLQIVRKRKLQTHLESLDDELTTLCLGALNSTHSSKSDVLEDISPRTAKIIKRSMDDFIPQQEIVKEETLPIQLKCGKILLWRKH